MYMVELPELEDFVEAHQAAGEVSRIRTPGFRRSTEDGLRKIAEVIDESGRHSDPYMVAATVLVETINRHPFNDGNHRTAWIVAKKVLRQNGEEMRVEDLKSLEEIRSDLRSEVKFKHVDKVAE